MYMVVKLSVPLNLLMYEAGQRARARPGLSCETIDNSVDARKRKLHRRYESVEHEESCRREEEMSKEKSAEHEESCRRNERMSKTKIGWLKGGRPAASR